MATTPVVNTTGCDSVTTGTSFTVTLPTWANGDLVVIFFGTDAISGGANWDPPPSGWTKVTKEDLSAASGYIAYRVMQTGDTDPTFTCTKSRAQAAIIVVIDDGTFDSSTPIDANTAEDGWGGGKSTTPQATAITTNTANTRAFAMFACDGGGTPFSVTTGGWSETHSSDCSVSGTGATGVCVADKEIATASSTGNVDFSQNLNEEWRTAIVAVKGDPGAGPVGGPTDNSLSLMGAGI